MPINAGRLYHQNKIITTNIDRKQNKNTVQVQTLENDESSYHVSDKI